MKTTNFHRAFSRAAVRLVLMLVTLACVRGAFAREAPVGLPLITVFGAEQHHGGAQSFQVVQDSRGLLYFANLGGVLTYDGAWWRMIPLPEDNVAFTIAVNSRDRIAVGGAAELGYLAADARGIVAYHSLLPKMQPGDRQFGDVRRICTDGDAFVYLTDRALFRWDGSNLARLARFNDDNAPTTCATAGSRLAFGTPRGIMMLGSGGLVPSPWTVAGGVDLLQDAGGGDLLAYVHETGLVRAGARGVESFAPEASQWLKDKVVTSACRLADGRYVITTRLDGALILSAAGDVDQLVDEAAGLPGEVLAFAFPDREGSLWLAFHGPIVRVDVASPVSLLDARRGVKGSIEDVARADGRLYVATSHGLFAATEGPAGTAARAAQQVAGVPAPAWALQPTTAGLLVATADGVHAVDALGRASAVPGAEKLFVYGMLLSSDGQHVWLAMKTGLAVLRREGSGWKFDHAIEGAPPYVATLVEKDGVLWCGSVIDGIVRVDQPAAAAPKLTRYPGGEMNVFDIGGRVVFTRTPGEIVELSKGGTFVADRLLGGVRTPRGFFLLSEDAGGGVWVNSVPPRHFARKADGSYETEGKPLVPVSPADMQFLRADRDGVVWFGSDRGLYRYEPGSATATFAQPQPLITRAAAGDEHVIFGGAAQSAAGEKLPYSFRRLRIEFAPASFRPGVTYQYRLDPVESEWSRWSSEPFLDFTNLSEGTYIFHVRARGAGGSVSPEATWTFTVLPPWYRTNVALAMWMLVAALIVVGVVTLRTRALAGQASHLRERIAARTEELRLTVDQLRDAQQSVEEKNRQLEEANARLERMTLVDELTGIENRRYFQRALDAEWERARRASTSLALILLDLDHFKELNDTRGHPAGDACLRMVGQFLAESIRRGGDVVSRYGGEEFAILLPGCETPEAMRLAERLRIGVEQLGIEYGTTTMRRLTTSCGVASIKPDEGPGAEELIARADRALYLAKRHGRNCVRA